MTKDGLKFKSDLHMRALFGDYFVVSDAEVYVLSNKERMELQRKRVELGEGRDKAAGDFEFANFVMNLFAERVAKIEAKVYSATSELREMTQDELDVVSLDTLDLVLEVDDIETLGYYDFAIIIYQHITEAFGQGVKPGKKLRTS